MDTIFKYPSPRCEGYVHSVETCGTVDGPGLRYVLFLSGCPLRCRYCHNPDTQQLRSGKKVVVKDVVKQIQRYKPFIKKGGVTISGGEPLAQQLFVESLLKEVKKAGFHTALDTSGCFGTDVREGLLDEVDLVLLDLKSWGNEQHKKITGKSMEPTIAFAKHLESINKPAWIRFVYVPGLTDDDATINGVAEFAGSLSNIELVEILPFHKYGESKYKELNQKYTLSETPEPTDEATEAVRERFRSYGLTVR